MIFKHSGSVFGYKSYVSVYRNRGQGIAIMMNGDNGYALMMEIERSVAKVYGWSDDGVSKVGLVDVPLSILQTYVGNYTAMLDGQALQIEIYLAGNALMIKSTMQGTGSRSDLYPTANDTFLLRDDTIITGTLVFSKDGSGKVIFTISTPEGGKVVATRM